MSDEVISSAGLGVNNSNLNGVSEVPQETASITQGIPSDNNDGDKVAITSELLDIGKSKGPPVASDSVSEGSASKPSAHEDISSFISEEKSKSLVKSLEGNAH